MTDQRPSLLVAASLIAVAVLLPGAAGAQPDSASVSLVAQSPWVEAGGQVTVELRVSGEIDGTFLELQFLEAIDRKGLLELGEGVLPGPVGDLIRRPIADHLNAAGVVSLEFDARPATGLVRGQGIVHPLAVTLLTTGGTELDHLITPVVHLPTVPQDRALMVALGFNVTGPPPLQADGSTKLDERTVRDLRALADAVGDHPSVPVDVRLPPATIVGLSRSVELADASLLAALERAVDRSLHVAATPYVTADPEAWRQADRADVFSDLLDHGELVLAERLRTEPTREVALLPPTAVPATLDLLHRLGSNRFVVSGSRLDPRPTDEGSLVRPIWLPGTDGSIYPALVADPHLANHLADTRGAVSAVQHLMADLALLSWAGSTEPAGVVVIVPPGLSFDGLMLDLLLGALDTAPFLEPTTLSSMFDTLIGSRLDTGRVHDMWPDAVVGVSRRATDRSLAEVTVAAYSALLGGPHPAAAHLSDLLEVTAAAELDNDAMSPYLAAVYAKVTEVLSGFSTPDDQNVRLTSRRADVPFTIENLLGSRAHVLLVLQSDGRLDFPDGPTLPALLEPGTNRIPIPVEARTSGGAQLQVTVRSPDDARLLQLESTRMLVRTTRLSGVGILLFVGAVAVLAVWWFRSTRLRSRQSGEAI